MAIRRHQRRSVRRDRRNTGARPSFADGRSSWRDIAIMAVIASVFIAVFAFSISRTPAPVAMASDQSAIPPMAAPQRTDQPSNGDGSTFVCENARIVDGDTIHCGEDRVRLASIDAPEMPGHCRRGRACVDGDPFASKANLERLMADGPIRCRQTDTDHYGRIVAFCETGGRDFSCAQVEGHFAIERYGSLSCPAR
jgi:endonuclease YncB( thermonuclease family)